MSATPGKQELWTCEHDGDLLSKKKLENKNYLGMTLLLLIRKTMVMMLVMMMTLMMMMMLMMMVIKY